ncbi:MAG: TolC family protein [candidate division KSB1 bacterium]|nr:TolC family protein [candidate division KSB1 bacterium]MDZ7369466.1 TolC family protein [candidate division KSB1 bacterium]MDZ7407578.1 TolC family protein [candidate division KSB1 bacterium]
MKQVKTLLLFCAAVLFAVNTVYAQNGRPLTLDECVGIALRDNSTLRNAERRAQIAGTNVMTARASILPSINSTLQSGKIRQGDRTVLGDVPVGLDPVTGRAIYERRTITQPGYSSNSNSAQINASLLLFDFGTSWNRIRQANAAEEASIKAYQSTKQNTILLVHQRYFGYLKELQLLAVDEEAVKSSEEQLKRTESMYEIGSVAQGDVFRARTQNGQDRISLITQKNLVNNARNLLNVAMGRPADAELNVVDVEDEPQIRDYNLEEVIKIAIEKNPELQSVQFEMKRAQIGRRVAMSAFLPSFSISGNYSRSHNEFDRVYSDFGKNWFGSVGLSMRLNLFNGFADQANVEREGLNYRIAEEEYQNRLRNLRLEAEQALLALKAWKEITEINQNNLISAQEDLRLAQERYRVGAGTLLDIINAQVNVTRAKSTLVRAKYDSKIALAQLQAVMGTLGQQ